MRRLFMTGLLAVAVALLVPGVAHATAEDSMPTGLQAALARAAKQYQVALHTLETRGQEETAAQVRLLRNAWHEVVQRYEATRPAAAHDDQRVTLFVDVDMRLVGILLVIDLGNRDAARNALISVGEIIARWQATRAPLPK